MSALTHQTHGTPNRVEHGRSIISVETDGSLSRSLVEPPPTAEIATTRLMASFLSDPSTAIRARISARLIEAAEDIRSDRTLTRMIVECLENERSPTVIANIFRALRSPDAPIQISAACYASALVSDNSTVRSLALESLTMQKDIDPALLTPICIARKKNESALPELRLHHIFTDQDIQRLLARVHNYWSAFYIHLSRKHDTSGLEPRLRMEIATWYGDVRLQDSALFHLICPPTLEGLQHRFAIEHTALNILGDESASLPAVYRTIAMRYIFDHLGVELCSDELTRSKVGCCVRNLHLLIGAATEPERSALIRDISVKAERATSEISQIEFTLVLASLDSRFAQEAVDRITFAMNQSGTAVRNRLLTVAIEILPLISQPNCDRICEILIGSDPYQRPERLQRLDSAGLVSPMLADRVIDSLLDYRLKCLALPTDEETYARIVQVEQVIKTLVPKLTDNKRRTVVAGTAFQLNDYKNDVDGAAHRYDPSSSILDGYVRYYPNFALKIVDDLLVCARSPNQAVRSIMYDAVSVIAFQGNWGFSRRIALFRQLNRVASKLVGDYKKAADDLTNGKCPSDHLAILSAVGSCLFPYVPAPIARAKLGLFVSRLISPVTYFGVFRSKR